MQVLRQTNSNKQQTHVPCICKSTTEVLDLLNACVVPSEYRSSCMFCKLDVEDFYMRGSPAQLSSGLFEHLGTKTKRVCQDMIHHILSSQYVSLDNDEVFHVTQGSGMGQIISGDVADVKFYNLVEKSFASSQIIQQQNNVWLYARYRDDIFIVYSSRSGDRDPYTFVKTIKEYASPVYVVKLEEVSKTKLAFLDVEIYKSLDFLFSGRLSYRPHVKPSAQKIPLIQTSSHCDHIHHAWPLANIARLHARSSTVREFNIARNKIVWTYERAFMSRQVTERLKSWLPNSGASRRAKPQKVSWIVIPYHPTLCRQLNRRLDIVCNRWLGRNFNLVPRLSFSDAGSNLQNDCFREFSKRSG